MTKLRGMLNDTHNRGDRLTRKCTDVLKKAEGVTGVKMQGNILGTSLA